MPNLIDCPACRHELQVPPDLLGQLVKCPMCSKTFTAPTTVEDVTATGQKVASNLAVGTTAGSPASSSSPLSPGQTPIRRGFRCPYCQSEEKPLMREQISIGGWVVFAVLLFVCAPVCWIGLLIKEEYRVCSDCGKKLSDTIL